MITPPQNPLAYLRQTGRTTRLIDHALDIIAKPGGRVCIAAYLDRGAEDICRQLLRRGVTDFNHPESRLRVISCDDSEFNLHLLKVLSLPDDFFLLIDPAVIEINFREIVYRLHAYDLPLLDPREMEYNQESGRPSLMLERAASHFARLRDKRLMTRDQGQGTTDTTLKEA